MTEKTAIRLLLLQSVLVVGLAWAAIYLGRDEFRLFSGREQDEVPTRSRLDNESRLPAVQLSAAGAKQIGIELVRVEPARFAPQQSVAVTVIDPQPLVELRGRMQAGRLALQAAQAAVTASRGEEARVRALYEDDRNASQRALQAASAQAQADAVRARAAETALESLRAQARASWGVVVAGWLDALDAGPIDRLANGTESLLRASVRAEDAIGKPGTLRVSIPGHQQARAAAPLGPAPQADAHQGGSGLLYRLSASDLRPGMRLAGNLSHGQQQRAGALLPASAVIWYAGKPWVYVSEAEPGDTDAGAFRRRDISGGERLGDAWFVLGLDDDAEVVLRGAQTLLSEELKFQIKNENDD